ncbi:hypothetical protein NFI96_031345, partial [Prochilodus magdalenae]
DRAERKDEEEEMQDMYLQSECECLVGTPESGGARPTKITQERSNDSSKKTQKTPQPHPKNCRPHLPQLRADCTIRHYYIAGPPFGCKGKDNTSSVVAHPVDLHQWSHDTAHKMLLTGFFWLVNYSQSCSDTEAFKNSDLSV